MQTKTYIKGYTLVEMVIYVSVMSVVTLLIVNTVLTFSKSYKEINALRIVDGSAIDSMERITRDIRGSVSVDTVNSTLGSNPGVLTIVQSSGSQSTTTKFYVDNGTLKVDVNGVYSGPLTGTGIVVDSLVFSKMDSSVTSAIKIDMTLTGNYVLSSKTKIYHTTVLLKTF